MLTQASIAADSEDASTTCSTSSCPSESMASSLAAEPKPTVFVLKLPAISKEPATLSVTMPENVANEERKANAANSHHLEVIIETDAISDPSTTPTTKCNLSQGAHVDCCLDDADVTVIERTLNALSLLAAEDGALLPSATSCSCLAQNTHDDDYVDQQPKYRYNCRRAYSYPVTNHAGGGAAALCNTRVRYVAPAATAFACLMPAARSRSVSATCSYISEFSVAAAQRLDDDDLVDVSMAKRSLIALAERHTPASVLLELDGQYDVLRSKLLLQTTDGSGDAQERVCDQILANEGVKRRRKLTAFGTADQTLLLEPDANI